MQTTTIKNLSILILDNEQKIAGLVRDVLFRMGFSSNLLFTANDGFEGFELMRRRPVPFDLIITDWELLLRSAYRDITQNALIRSEHGEFMPINGADFVRCLRHSPKSPNPFVPVIMLTGPTQPNYIRYARDAGVNEILLKPLVAEELAKRIVSAVESPRDFIACHAYRGPCRRRKHTPPESSQERRRHDRKVIRHVPKTQLHNFY